MKILLFEQHRYKAFLWAIQIVRKRYRKQTRKRISESPSSSDEDIPRTRIILKPIDPGTLDHIVSKAKNPKH